MALNAARAIGFGVARVAMPKSALEPLILKVNSSLGLGGIQVATGKIWQVKL